MAQVAFLGTGLMGAGMVERQRALGTEVKVWNRTKDKAMKLGPLGASVRDDPMEAVRGAERVHLVLSDDAAVDAVLGSIVPALSAEQVVIDHSTTSPARTRERAERLRSQGVSFLHAPVFMSPTACRNGAGLMLVAGATDLVERVRQGLSAMTGEVWHVGTAGDRAAAFKLFGNAMIFAMCAGLSDVFAIGKSLGISSPEVQELFSHFNVAPVLAYRGRNMAERNWTALFELSMARKDLRLMLEAASPEQDLLVLLPVIARRFDALLEAGHGKDDLGVLAVDTATLPGSGSETAG